MWDAESGEVVIPKQPIVVAARRLIEDRMCFARFSREGNWVIPSSDGDTVVMEIDGLGRLSVNVRDDWKRTWPRETLSKMTGFESSIRSGF